MKKINSAAKTIAIFLFVGTLLFSCAFNNKDDYGYLALTLPGSGSSVRYTVGGPITTDDGGFLNRLRYGVTCTGPGSTVTREFTPGSAASIPLLPGTWDVTVSVWNVADSSDPLGDSKITVTIEPGATTTEKVQIPIITSRCEIKSFWLTLPGPISAVGTIDEEEKVITVNTSSALFNSLFEEIFPTPGQIGLSFRATHTGAYITPSSDGDLSFEAFSDDVLDEDGVVVDEVRYFESIETLKVTAYIDEFVFNEYTVRVEIDPYEGMFDYTYPNWFAIPWSDYGLSVSVLPNMSGKFNTAGAIEEGGLPFPMLGVALERVDVADYNNLVMNIKSQGFTYDASELPDFFDPDNDLDDSVVLANFDPYSQSGQIGSMVMVMVGRNQAEGMIVISAIRLN